MRFCLCVGFIRGLRLSASPTAVILSPLCGLCCTSLGDDGDNDLDGGEGGIYGDGED